MRCCCINNGAKPMVMNVDIKHLPLDVLVHILVRLPIESLCCIRCVSKAMLDMVDSHSFVALHTRSLVACTHNVPQLMYFTRFFNPPTFKDPRGYEELAALQTLKYGKTTLTKGKHALTLLTSEQFDRHRYKVDFVFYNLFCFRNVHAQDTYYGHCFLVNPLRGEILRLPPRDIQDRKVVFWADCYGMGFDSLAGTYKIVRVSRISNGRSDDKSSFGEQFLVSHVFELGTSSWRDIPSVPPYDLHSLKSVSAYGDMH
ncbi:hypothetical protein ACLB2K_064311 [Fragaria x ananassa]